ncbi:MAG: malate dehydrogenase [Deltaproteobacteria bacterium]|nr:malate dehydrogenase [Deltaproteobacteria bacterium]MBW2596366.1 malate dehydrogenase [Deltaproteobacteria bacterium]MBW2650275.1 malate dehydrogenase [Deltaproteobacteria bacterium]
MKRKVSVIGAGFVGTMTAQRIVEKNLADVVLLDIVEGLPQGKALDIMQSAPVEGFDRKITGSNDFAETEHSDIVVFTAGFPRTPGMNREELAMKNGGIVKSVVETVARHAPDCIIIMVTNPLDVMTHLAWKTSGFPAKRVMGMGGVLDSARYRAFLAEELNVSAKDIETMVLGSHGDTMVPVDTHTTLKGIPISRLIEKERLDAIIERTKNGGAEIVSLLKSGSAWHAPSSSVIAMVDAILGDSKRILPASAYLTGQYGIEDVHIGVPVKLGASGIEEIYETALSNEELKGLKRSADAVRETFEKLQI